MLRWGLGAGSKKNANDLHLAFIRHAFHRHLLNTCYKWHLGTAVDKTDTVQVQQGNVTVGSISCGMDEERHGEPSHCDTDQITCRRRGKEGGLVWKEDWFQDWFGLAGGSP